LKIHPPADHEITQLQQRIYLHRLGLRLSIETAKEAFRERLGSPGMLLGAGATGFMLDRLTRRRTPRNGRAQPQPSVASRGFGVVAEALRTGLKFLQSGPGLWLAGRLAARAAERGPQDSSAGHPQ
jgi:hypothetical protein